MEQSLTERSALYSSVLSTASSQLQVALILEDVLPTRDYSKPIETLDSIARGSYEMGRETLELMEENGPFYDSKPTLRDDYLMIKGSDHEWILMDDTGAAEGVYMEHLDAIGEASTSSFSGIELRGYLEEYEQLVESAVHYGVADLEPIDDPLKDQEDKGEVREDDDAVLF
jgi:hypothetical protein